MRNNLLSPFYEFAQQNPYAVASTDSSGEITYGQLFENTLRFYRSVTDHEFPNKKVILLFPNGIEALSAIFSVLTAGLCYSIIDPSTPADRIKVICQSGNFDYLITNDEFLAEAQKLFNSGRIRIYQDLLDKDPVEFALIPDVELTDGAFMFFTSGSTDTPKGLIHNHGSMRLATITSTATPNDHYDFILPLSFVATVNIFWALSKGATISFFDVRKKGVPEYFEFIKKEKITQCMMTVTVFRAVAQMLKDTEKLETLRTLLLVGEPIKPSDIVLFRKHTLNSAKLIQTYGSSETLTVAQTIFGHEEEISDKITAGKILPGITIFILDDTLSELPVGSTGQIAISSPMMISEYFKNPENTKESFWVDTKTGLLFFLTGDLGYVTEDGFLYHEGRKDFMVKVRGSRVDILEIEDCLLKHPSVSNTIVVNKGDSFAETLLIAYCEVKNEVKIQELREYVASKLPVYMVPSFFVLKDKLPQTFTGKTDRKKLTDDPLDYSLLLGEGENSQIEFDPLYDKLKIIWLEELKLPRMSPDHSFFNDLGGDSLLAVSVLERIRIELGIKLSYFILFRYRTLGKLVEYIHRVENRVVSIEALREPKDEKSPVIIFVPPVKGGADTYRFAMKSYPQNFGLYELTYNLADDENKFFYSLDYLMELAAKAVEQLNIPEVSLYGYSMGGLLAYEIASRIKLVKVRSVIILDIPPALNGRKNIFGLIYNDYRLILKNILKRDWKALSVNFWHISICHYYLFAKGFSIKRFELKNNTTMTEAAHLRFYRQFNHKPFSGDMLLIRSTDPHLKHYKYNWEKFVKGTITTERIETTHYQMLNHINDDLLTQIVVRYFQ